jgi:heme-binding protein
MIPSEKRAHCMNSIPLRIAGIAAGLAALAAVTVTASAQPAGQCTAASLSSALGSTASGTGAWLGSHPEANDVITGVGTSGNRDAVRAYFVNHQDQWAELQGIAAPLRTLRDQCGGGSAGKATEIGALYQAMVGGQ